MNQYCNTLQNNYIGGGGGGRKGVCGSWSKRKLTKRFFKGQESQNTKDTKKKKEIK